MFFLVFFVQVLLTSLYRPHDENPWSSKYVFRVSLNFRFRNYRTRQRRNCPWRSKPWFLGRQCGDLVAGKVQDLLGAGVEFCHPTGIKMHVIIANHHQTSSYCWFFIRSDIFWFCVTHTSIRIREIVFSDREVFVPSADVLGAGHKTNLKICCISVQVMNNSIILPHSNGIPCRNNILDRDLGFSSLDAAQFSMHIEHDSDSSCLHRDQNHSTAVYYINRIGSHPFWSRSVSIHIRSCAILALGYRSAPNRSGSQ